MKRPDLLTLVLVFGAGYLLYRYMLHPSAPAQATPGVTPATGAAFQASLDTALTNIATGVINL